jgi:hypothetical protein
MANLGITRVGIEEAIRHMVNNETNRVKDEVVKEAVRKFEYDLRAAMAKVAIVLHDHVSYERCGNELIITIRGVK